MKYYLTILIIISAISFLIVYRKRIVRYDRINAWAGYYKRLQSPVLSKRRDELTNQNTSPDTNTGEKIAAIDIILERRRHKEFRG